MALRRTTHRDGWGGARAVIAVLALYALVLQGFLGGLMPAMALPGDIPCLAASGPAPAAHDPADCCLAVHLAAVALQSRGPAVACPTWPPAAAAPVAGGRETAFRPRTPPHAIPPPRGPPAA